MKLTKAQLVQAIKVRLEEANPHKVVQTPLSTKQTSDYGNGRETFKQTVEKSGDKKRLARFRDITMPHGTEAEMAELDRRNAAGEDVSDIAKRISTPRFDPKAGAAYEGEVSSDLKTSFDNKGEKFSSTGAETGRYMYDPSRMKDEKMRAKVASQLAGAGFTADPKSGKYYSPRFTSKTSARNVKESSNTKLTKAQLVDIIKEQLNELEDSMVHRTEDDLFVLQPPNTDCRPVLNRQQIFRLVNDIKKAIQ